MRHGASALGLVLDTFVLVVDLVGSLSVVVLTVIAMEATSFAEVRLLFVTDVVVWMLRMQGEHCRRRGVE